MGQDESHWKQKYLDSLEELERKEREWDQTGSALRRCISRLSFIGDGRDRDLDQRLEKLRNRVRGERDIAKLQKMIDGIALAAEQLGGEGAGTAADPRAISAPLIDLLEQLPFPRECRSAQRKLKKQLKRQGLDASSLQGLRDLLQQAFDSLGSQATPTGAEGGGLLGRLFSRTAGEAPVSEDGPQEHPSSQDGAQVAGPRGGETTAVSTDPQSASDSTPDSHPHRSVAASQAEPSDPIAGLQTTPLEEIKAALLQLLDRLESRLKNRLPWGHLRERIQGADKPVALQQESDRLAGLLAELVTGDNPGEVLLKLMERLEFPPSLAEESGLLKAKLTRGLEPRQLTRAIEDLAELVDQARHQAELERREVEQFLLQLTERIQALNQGMLDIGDRGQDQAERNLAFGEQMQSDVDGLHASVAEAADLDELKLSISERLAQLGERLKQQRESENRYAKELEQQVNGLNSRICEMEQEARELKQKVDQARRAASEDALTGLNNRFAFDTRMEQEYSRWSRYPFPMSLIMVDVDHFKRINDRFGHKAGDKVLSVLGKTLRSELREVDFPARYGGEEFVILLPETGLESARQVAEKVRMAIKSKGFKSGDKPVEITVSCGLARFKEGDTAESVFERADRALYLAKNSGRDRCCSENDLEASEPQA